MKKSILIFSVAIITLLCLQGFWLYVEYANLQQEVQVKTNLIFTYSIQEEVNIRLDGSYKKKNNPKWIVKSAKDMTPEERAKLKGDTITLNRARKDNLGETLPEIFTQTLQDKYLFTNPIRLSALDSIFQERLQKEGLSYLRSSITLYNEEQVAQKTIGQKFYPFFPTCLTEMRPIGTKGLMFVQAQIQILPKQVLAELFFILIVSCLMAVLLVCCLYYQLVVIRRTRKQLEERESAVYCAIHDLKAPLNSVFTILDYTQTTVDDKEVSGFISKGIKHIAKLTATIESMMELIKNSSGKPQLKKEPVDLIETIQSIYEGLQAQYPEKKYSFEIKNQTSVSFITTDVVRLERCLRNLIENALKYSDDGVEITVILKEEKGMLQIGIQDTGWGIPKKAQKHLGEQFFRIRQADKPAREGIGIGLSSVRQLVKELGGKFSFVSQEGDGSTFFVNLPL